MNNDEIPKYKKRKNNSSKSSKRSDHKHDYQMLCSNIKYCKEVEEFCR